MECGCISKVRSLLTVIGKRCEIMCLKSIEVFYNGFYQVCRDVGEYNYYCDLFRRKVKSEVVTNSIAIVSAGETVFYYFARCFENIGEV